MKETQDAVFDNIPIHPCDHERTGRYRGGHDFAGGYEAGVVFEERTCGAWVVVQSFVEPPAGQQGAGTQ